MNEIEYWTRQIEAIKAKYPFERNKTVCLTHQKLFDYSITASPRLRNEIFEMTLPYIYLQLFKGNYRQHFSISEAISIYWESLPALISHWNRNWLDQWLEGERCIYFVTNTKTLLRGYIGAHARRERKDSNNAERLYLSQAAIADYNREVEDGKDERESWEENESSEGR